MKQEHHQISDIPFSERPRERLQRLGASVLSDMELLAILLRTGVRGTSALGLAEDLLNAADGSLEHLAGFSLQEMTALNGMGLTKAITLVAAFELSRRRIQQGAKHQPVMNSPAKVAEYCRSHIASPTREELHILMLDSKLRIMGDELISIGLIDRSLAHAREIFRPAIRMACYQILLWHNHPSGDSRPSKEDDEMTKNILIAGRILAIEMVDHIVIGKVGNENFPGGYYSYREQGRLKME